ncbi:PadR family transcriptional regulator [Thermoactinospora rubra]|uniref:PadR family transcriptional regulator n=1 Tax=Thermoactinospora rubra TaxID=1088767 RepID=UPI000A10A229|nr:PadR family transcriptional regulator [Thermoactinospora rubra]
MTSSTRMLVLGLLQQRPMHGYEITQLVAENELDRWAPVLPGSIYHALTTLERDGLVRAEAEERTGDRRRRIYAITPAGRTELEGLLLDVLAQPPHGLQSALPLALAWIELLPRERVLARLAVAMERLTAARQRYRQGRELKSGLSPLAEAVFDNAEAIIDADECLLRRLLDLLS